MRTTIAALTFGVAIALGGTAGAAEPEDFAHTGGYVGGGFLGALNETDLDDAAGDGLGFDLRGGYRFHPHFAVEGQLSYFDNIGGDFGVADVDLDVLTGTVNLKGFLLPGRIQPYAQVGIGGTYLNGEVEFLGSTVSEDSTAEFTFRGGGGVDIYLTPHVLLYTEATYVLLTGDFDGDGFIPLVFGAQYRF
jgi:opacity protein-like surface antigen